MYPIFPIHPKLKNFIRKNRNFSQKQKKKKKKTLWFYVCRKRNGKQRRKKKIQGGNWSDWPGDGRHPAWPPNSKLGNWQGGRGSLEAMTNDTSFSQRWGYEKRNWGWGEGCRASLCGSDSQKRKTRRETGEERELKMRV